MKDFEFITEEEIDGIVSRNNQQKMTHREPFTRLINKLLNDKCLQGTCRAGTLDFICGDIPKQATRKTDTHHAYVFLQPIEPEKVECSWCELFYKVAAKSADDDLNFCPKCGSELKK